MPVPKRCATRLAMVWLLPVPGGPITTKSLPPSAVATTAICDASAGRGSSRSAGASSSSSRFGSTKPPCPAGAYTSFGVSSRCRTTAFSRNASVRSTKSFHIRCLAKEKCPRAISSTTSKPAMSRTCRRMVFQMPATSMPLSSAGRPSSNSRMSSAKSLRSISSSVVLKRGSSSWCVIFTPLRTERRSSATGSSTSGARKRRASFSLRFHSRKPSAR